jgi:hypothetical protein
MFALPCVPHRIIEFATTMDAEDAVKKLDGMEIRGVRVEVVLDVSRPGVSAFASETNL